MDNKSMDPHAARPVQRNFLPMETGPPSSGAFRLGAPEESFSFPLAQATSEQSRIKNTKESDHQTTCRLEETLGSIRKGKEISAKREAVLERANRI